MAKRSACETDCQALIIAGLKPVELWILIHR